MGKQFSTCPRCSRPYQTVTGLPCGMGDCGSRGGSGSKGQPKGRTHQTTKGEGPGSAGGMGVQRQGFLESLGCSTVIVALASGAAGIVLAIGELVRALA